MSFFLPSFPTKTLILDNWSRKEAVQKGHVLFLCAWNTSLNDFLSDRIFFLQIENSSRIKIRRGQTQCRQWCWNECAATCSCVHENLLSFIHCESCWPGCEMVIHEKSVWTISSQWVSSKRDWTLAFFLTNSQGQAFFFSIKVWTLPS